MAVFIRHQQPTGHALQNALVKILQGLKLVAHLDKLGFQLLAIRPELLLLGPHQRFRARFVLLD